MATSSSKLRDQLRTKIRTKHHSIRTVEAYVSWTYRLILFHNKTHPKDMGASEVELFLSHLAEKGHVAASTQNQALNALVFLYRRVLNNDLGDMQNISKLGVIRPADRLETR